MQRRIQQSLKRLFVFIMLLSIVLPCLPHSIEPIMIEAKMKKGVTGADIVAEARKYVGNPYVYGGSSLTNGCDCAWFVALIYKKFDNKFVHKSSGSYIGYTSKLVKVDKVNKESDIKKYGEPGDIIVWNGHAGIYAGNNRMIDAKGKDYGIVYGKISSGNPFLGLMRHKALVGVNNTETSSSEGSTETPDGVQEASSTEKKKAQKALGVTDKQVKQMQAGWDAAISSGWSEAAIAGAYGNIQQECGFNPKCEESGGAGIGLCQWTDDSEHSAFVKFSAKCGHTPITMKGLKVCGKFACQIAFMITDIEGRYRKNNSIYLRYNDYVKDFANVKKGQHGITHADPKNLYTNIKYYKTYKDFTKADSAPDAAIAFHTNYEISAGTNYLIHREMDRVHSYGRTDADFFVAIMTVRPKMAERAMTLFGGTQVQNHSSNADKETAGQIATALKNAGYWSEEQFVNFVKMEEVELDFLTSDDLTEEELYNKELWQSDIKETKTDSILIRGGRWFVMLVGILLIVWMILVYMSFWFDRINNFVEIEMLPLLTFGKLKAAETDDECTWSVKGSLDGKQKTINNKYLFIVVCIGCAVGTLLVSGQLFIWTGKLVNGVMNLVRRL